jgi:hypothetical protein
MFYNLAAAASATGLTRTAILKAIKSGTIFATKDELGEWRIEPAELHRVFPPVATHRGSREPTRRYSGSDLDALTAQIEALLRQAGNRLRQQFDDVRRDRDGGRQEPQATQLLFADEESRGTV